MVFDHAGDDVAKVGGGSTSTSVHGNPWVIAGKLPGSRLSDLQPFWQRLRARGGLKDARIHDLRHTFASAAVAAGQGLPMIGKLGPHAGGNDGALCAPRSGSS